MSFYLPFMIHSFPLHFSCMSSALATSGQVVIVQMSRQWFLALLKKMTYWGPNIQY